MSAIQGYILINSRKWRVSMRVLNTLLSLKKRKNGKDGDHLVEIQAYLEQPQYRMLVDALCQGTTLCLPKNAAEHPTPPSLSAPPALHLPAVAGDKPMLERVKANWFVILGVVIVVLGVLSLLAGSTLNGAWGIMSGIGWLGIDYGRKHPERARGPLAWGLLIAWVIPFAWLTVQRFSR